MANELLILIHASAGSISTIISVWLFAELINAKESNVSRIKLLAIMANVMIWLSYIIGGLYYIFDYSTVDKYIIKGSDELGFSGSLWTFAHSFFTESKEHFFFLGIILGLYILLLAYKAPFTTDERSKQLMIVLTAILVLGGVILEGWGAIMAMGVRLGMTPT